VEVNRGISRHVVRFVSYGEAIYALKEMPPGMAEREYRLLRRLLEEALPVVKPVGVVAGRATSEEHPTPLPAVLITRHLDFSLPYRFLFTGRGIPDLRNRLLDSLVQLLVRLHLAGFFWGDCSLSNTLFRRDAGALAAYLVDAETGELHPSLSDGQRKHDLLIAEQNIAGELMDVDAELGLPGELDPVEVAAEIPHRYGDLWAELTKEEVFAPDERYRIDGRLRRLNELGYDVDELELIGGGDGDGFRLHLRPQVVERGHHRRLLHDMTGLDVQENQARRLLNDIATYRCEVEVEEGRQLPDSAVAFRWLSEVFEPTVQSIPEDLRGKLHPVELYHEVLEHRWFLSEAAGRDVGMEEAVRSYVQNVLAFAPDERSVLP
jgi:hypothetical protein